LEIKILRELFGGTVPQISEFLEGNPGVKCKLIRYITVPSLGLCCTSSPLTSVSHLDKSWAVSTRHMCGVPREMHRYTIEELGGQHGESMIIMI
jgi:hypothetical protein